MALKKKKQIIEEPVHVDKKFTELLSTFKCFQPTPNSNKPILKITNLKKKFRKHFKWFNALDGINLTIYSGDKIALLGANGAGKTTLLEIVSGINKATSGKIEYLYEYKKTPQERIGIQFQDATCPYGFSVLDLINVQNSILVNPLFDKDIANLVEIFKLKDLLNHRASRLSGGQQQRLNIALTFMTDPKLLFLDELSTALDIDMQVYMNEIVRTYVDEHKTTLVLSSHNVKEILYHTKRCVIIKKGKVMLDAPISAIIKHFKDFDFFLTNVIK